MNAVTPKLSVIICTHNPKPEYLQRVIGGAPGADARASEWELLVVDNKSTRPVSESVDLSWHPHAAVSIEEQLSTTAARLHGLRRTRADVLVFVDDDNVLAPDYLERALDIALTWPMLGSWGSAWCIQEFETDPAPRAGAVPLLPRPGGVRKAHVVELRR
ncbi:MAG: glycosyltransferase family A protein [Chthoniobacter sp.]